MLLYVIAVHGTDQSGANVSGIITANSIIDDDILDLNYTTDKKIQESPESIGYLLTQFDRNKAQTICKKLQDFVAGISTVNLVFTVTQKSFTSDQLDKVAEINCERFLDKSHDDFWSLV